MRLWKTVPVLLLALIVSLAPGAQAKKFKYTAGPKAATDTTYSVAEEAVEPVTRARGPKVAATKIPSGWRRARSATGLGGKPELISIQRVPASKLTNTPLFVPTYKVCAG